MKDIKRRKTRQRAVVLNVLRHTRAHPDAEWIYKEARKVIPNMSLGTVYRNLKILKDQQKIAEVKSEFSHSARYDAVVNPHAHFHCQECFSIYDVDGLDSPHLIRPEVIEKFGVLKSVQIVIHGICLGCSAAERETQ